MANNKMYDKPQFSEWLSFLKPQQPEVNRHLSTSQDTPLVNKLCKAAELYRQAQLYDQAIRTAQNAVSYAEKSLDRSLHGYALLHLSAARLSADLYNEQAILEYDRAIKKLRFDHHNLAIAQILRAEIEQSRGAIVRALFFFQQSTHTLQMLIKVELTRGGSDLAGAYQNQLEDVLQLIDELTQHLAADYELPIPCELIWPPIGLFEFRSLPLAGLDKSVKMLDYISVSRLSIDDHRYAIRALVPPSARSTQLQLLRDQKYVLAQVKTKSVSASSPLYVLVHCMQSLPGDRPVVAATISTPKSQERVWLGWLKWTPSPAPQVIGADPDSEQLIGIVKAILTQYESD
jgi:tetratricopeptide (TPR) repeat protein